MKRILAILFVLVLTVSGVVSLNPTVTYAASEIESNDTIVTAQPITLGDKVNGRLHETDESDVYHFEVPSTGIINCDLYSYADNIKVVIYDKDGDKIIDYDPSWNSDIKQSYDNYFLPLTKGTYYIQIAKDYWRKEAIGEYNFKLNYKSSDVKTGDTNNTLDTAYPIPLGKTINGQISLNDDTDFYKVTMKSSGKIGLTINGKMGKLYVAIYDDKFTKLSDKNLYRNDAIKQISEKINGISVKKGNYYIIIKRVTYSKESGTYNLKVSNQVSKITLNRSSVTLKKGQSIQLKAKISPTDAVNKKVKWISSKSYVASVSQSGKVTAKGKGVTYISCQTADGSGVVKNCKITVK